MLKDQGDNICRSLQVLNRDIHNDNENCQSDKTIMAIMGKFCMKCNSVFFACNGKKEAGPAGAVEIRRERR